MSVRSDDSHSSFELEGESLEGVARQARVRDGVTLFMPSPSRYEHGGVEADRLGDRWRTGFESGRSIGRGVAVGSDVGDHPAAAEERRHRIQDVLAGPKDTDAGRTEHLVTGEDEEVDVECHDVGRGVRDRLRAVDGDQGAVAVSDRREFANRVDRAQDVRHAGDREQLHAPHQLVDPARGRVGSRRSTGMKRTSMPVCSRNWNHGTMLAWCSISLTRTTSPALEVLRTPGLGQEVEGLGRVLGEDDLAGAAGSVDESGHRFARTLRRRRSPHSPSGRRRGARWRGAVGSSGSWRRSRRWVAARSRRCRDR